MRVGPLALDARCRRERGVPPSVLSVSGSTLGACKARAGPWGCRIPPASSRLSHRCPNSMPVCQRATRPGGGPLRLLIEEADVEYGRHCQRVSGGHAVARLSRRWRQHYSLVRQYSTTTTTLLHCDSLGTGSTSSATPRPGQATLRPQLLLQPILELLQTHQQKTSQPHCASPETLPGN